MSEKGSQVGREAQANRHSSGLTAYHKARISTTVLSTVKLNGGGWRGSTQTPMFFG